jgi:hypothetical protein
MSELLTFQQICELEPRVKALFGEAKAVHDDRSQKSFCANDVWFGIRSRLVKLVGFEELNPQINPQLTSSAVYDTVLNTIYEVLPPCRNCGCL